MKVVFAVVYLAYFFAGCTEAARHAALSGLSGKNSHYVTVQDQNFILDGESFHFVLANLWYGMNLAAPETGDPARLDRELDRLSNLGVKVVRVVAGTEGPDSEPIRMKPSLQYAPGQYNADLLNGLDHLLLTIEAHGMKAIVCLNNYWTWSGGFGQYLVWGGDRDKLPYPPPVGDVTFDEYQKFVARFYSHDKAQQIYRNFVEYIVGRYANREVIMAWELANEPRPMQNIIGYRQWVTQTSALIKQISPQNLVTVGSEGDTPHPHYSNTDYYDDHNFPNIDFGTMHIWPENFGWFDPKDPDSITNARMMVFDYIETHIQKTERLNKPLLLEEFGLARDNRNYEPGSSTVLKDSLYEAIFFKVVDSVTHHRGLQAVGFWAWSGEGRPVRPGDMWHVGEPWTGDPPHEAQGWYSVYDTDQSTLAKIADTARDLSSLNALTHDYP